MLAMTVPEFSRYRSLLSFQSQPALDRERRRAASDSVTLGVTPALLLLTPDPALHAPLAEGFDRLAALGRSGERAVLRDPAGHAREIYHALVLHLHLAAFSRHYETLPRDIWAACEDALQDAVLPARRVETFADIAPPPTFVAIVLWHALCLLEQSKLANRDVDVEVVDSIVHRVISRPGEQGSLHPRDEDESLDAWTYRELYGLHALANLALLRRNRAWSARVEEVAMHHLENTQPDNTTNEPWALFAFLWSAQTRSFAEQQIHDATTQGVGPVAAMLMADAANSLAAFG